MAKHLWQSTLFVFAVGLIALVVANAPLIRAQVITSGKPRLESASVRPCRTGERGNRSAPGLLNFQCVDLVNFNGFGMIQWAYGLDANIPVTGGPSWLASDLWDITAKAADNTSDWTMEGPMLQAVLEDRFKLRVHHETRQAPVYELAVAEGGPTLTPFKEGSCKPIDPGMRTLPPLAAGERPCPSGPGLARKGSNFVLAGHRTSLDQAADLLTRVLDRPVVDKSGIAGRFDFDLVFRSDETTAGYLVSGANAYHPMPSGEPLAQPIFTAVQQQLGLKLTPAQGPREFLVIDHVERPSEN